MESGSDIRSKHMSGRFAIDVVHFLVNVMLYTNASVGQHRLII